MPDVSSLSSLLTLAVLVLDYLARFALVIHIVLRRGERNNTTIAWIAVVLSLPVLGLVGYLLVGEPRLGRRRARRHQSIVDRISDAALPDSALPRLSRVAAPLAALAENVAHHSATGGNALELYGKTDLFIAAIVDAIDRAQDHCHLLFYIWLDDGAGRELAEALNRAARRGVTCRVLLDDVGSRGFLRGSTSATMRRAGVQVVGALPASLMRLPFSRVDLRNHRKLAVIDGTVAFTGSQNIADASFAPKARFAPWVDAAVRVSGPAVRDLHRLFVEDWYLDTNESLEELLAITPPVHADGVPVQVIGTGPSSAIEALVQVNVAGFYAAREEVVLTTPYFVPDLATAAAMRGAAQRGIQTHLVVPARNDSPLVAAASRSHYENLIEAGVSIHEFEGGLLHAKTLTIDRDIAMIGSANLDRRSFDLNFEVTLLVFDTDFASQLRFLQTSYLERSRVIHAAQWARRSTPRRLVQNTAGLLGPLL